MEGGFDKIVDVIVAADADIVALTEVRNYNDKDLHERLLAALEAKATIYHGRFGGGDVGLLTRFPIKGVTLLDESSGRATRSIVAYELELPADQNLFVACAHLDYRHYAAYLPRGYSAETFKLIDEDQDGLPDPVTDLKTIHQADAASQRDEAILGFIQWSKSHKRDDVLLPGDFTEPSHHDWVQATKDTQDHSGVVTPWKNSVRLREAGFIDTYRVVGPRELHVKGAVLDPKTDDLVILDGVPWPTDHRGVLIEFEYVGK